MTIALMGLGPVSTAPVSQVWNSFKFADLSCPFQLQHNTAVYTLVGQESRTCEVTYRLSLFAMLPCGQEQQIQALVFQISRVWV